MNAHFQTGMIATYNITGTRPAFNQTGTTRNYFVQAVSSSFEAVLFQRMLWGS